MFFVVFLVDYHMINDRLLRQKVEKHTDTKPACFRVKDYLITIGLIGEPEPRSIFKGAAVNINVY